MKSADNDRAWSELSAAGAIDLAGVLGVALEVGLLERLHHQVDDAAGHARALGLAAGPTARVLAVLAAAGLATRSTDGRWTATPALSGAAAASPMGLVGQRLLWSQLHDHLRQDTQIALCDGTDAERSEVYHGVVNGLGAFFARSAAGLAAHLVSTGPIERVLDVGAGSGVWGLSVLKAAPAARLVALDLPDVVGRVAENAAAARLLERTELCARSWHDGPFPGRHDVIILASVLHLEPAAAARDLVHRAAAALGSGGRLVIVDSLTSRVPAHAIAHAVYALHLAMRTRGGTPHSEAALTSWLAEASLDRIERVPLSAPSMNALIARSG